MLIRFLALAIIFALPACAVFQAKEPVWPAELKHHDYFLTLYQQDSTNTQLQNLDQYQTWIICFYQGSELYPKGWNSITEELLLRNKVNESAEDIKKKMERLGLLISGEWAKNNKSRLITTRHVSIWANALIKSLEQGETLALIDRVTIDVEDLLARRISAEHITEDRFYAEEDLFEYLN